MSTRLRSALLILIWIAAFLRFKGLFANSFHADEALFATWARLIATWSDPLLITPTVDKPPLLFYLQALFFPFFGPEAWVARLPGWIASLLLIPLSARLALALYRRQSVALLTAAFVTLSPLLIQFSPTAFIDPLLATLLVAALWAAAAGVDGQSSARPSGRQWHRQPSTWSGVLFGLALASKYQALLFMPLIAVLLVAPGANSERLRRWLAGFLPLLSAVVIWDVARSGGFSLWQAQMNSYGGLRLAWSWELWPRLADWSERWGYLLQAWPTAFGALLLLLFGLGLFVRGKGKGAVIDRVLALFLLAYFAFHWLVAVPAWDRYVVPAAALVGLLLAHHLVRLTSYWLDRASSFNLAVGRGNPLPWLLLLALLLLLGPGALMARQGRLPVAGQPHLHHDIGEVAAAFDDAPYGTVLYDHWFSWQWRYHLFDSKVYVSWFPNPAHLVEDLTVFADEGPGRFVAVPSGPEALPVLRALGEAGYGLVLVEPSSGNEARAAVLLYQIVSNGL